MIEEEIEKDEEEKSFERNGSRSIGRYGRKPAQGGRKFSEIRMDRDENPISPSPFADGGMRIKENAHNERRKEEEKKEKRKSNKIIRVIRPKDKPQQQEDKDLIYT
jgi:hypothetical protein